MDTTYRVLFVCPHGAAKSRMAAAFFNRVAPPGWEATSAGITPQETVSLNAIRLLKDGDAEALLDLTAPRPMSAVPLPDRLVAIDCDILHAEHWELAHQEFAAPMREELRGRVEALVQEIVNG